MSEMNTTIENLKPIQGNNAANTLEAFVFEKTQKVNDVLVEAQRLINLYRQLNVLGPDFVPTFDKMLLSSKPDVQLALSNLSSGDTVRQYLKFLQSRLHQNTDPEKQENNSISEDAASYLPSPDEVPPFQMTPHVVLNGGETVAASAQPEALGALIKALTDAQQKAAEQQNAFLKQALNQMQQNVVQAQNTGSGNAGFDMAQFQETQQKIINETIERVTSEQAKLLTDSLTEVLRNTQQIAQEQVQSISSLIAAGNASAYPHIEEYVEPAEMPARPAQPTKPVPERKKGKAVSEPKVASPTPPDVPEDIEILSEIDLPTDNL